MRIKSFYANTVEGAVALARRELGEEAMLVESRKTPLETRHLGEYEVVCALVPAADSPKPSAAEDATAHGARLATELAEMRRQLDVMGKTISRSAWSGTHWPGASPEMAEWHARLMAADLEGDLVQEVLEAARRRAAPDGIGLDSAVATALEERILVNGTLAAPSPDGPRIAALVGPPGAGKTTMIAKLAVTCGLAARHPLVLLSMDDYRVAGAEQLRSYATILGAGFQALESVGALAQALDEHRGKYLILIDTPGYGPRDMDRAADLAHLLSARPSIATHLVLTACMKSADLTHVVDRFEIFRPSSLLFTRLDETASFGTAFSLSVRQGKPISFLGTGQDIPDDVEPATGARILNLLWPESLSPARLAA
jgi:flagellar biosynthesis protein FlhF